MGLDSAPSEFGPLIEAASRIATADGDCIDNETRDSARSFLRWAFDNYGREGANPEVPNEGNEDDGAHDDEQP